MKILVSRFLVTKNATYIQHSTLAPTLSSLRKTKLMKPTLAIALLYNHQKHTQQETCFLKSDGKEPSITENDIGEYDRTIKLTYK